MRQHALSNNAFLELCKSGEAEKVEDAITNGASVKAKDKNGWTALICA